MLGFGVVNFLIDVEYWLFGCDECFGCGSDGVGIGIGVYFGCWFVDEVVFEFVIVEVDGYFDESGFWLVVFDVGECVL